jgi:MscS family membrane protein
MPLLKTLLFALAIAGMGQSAHAACESPLSATTQFLDNLQDGSGWQPAQAIACFPEGDGMEETAIHLKQVLDAKGVFIDFDSLSTDPDFTDAQGAHKALLNQRMGSIYLSKENGNWRFSDETVASVPALYSQSFSGASKTIRRLLPSPFHKPLPGGTQGWQWALFGLLIAVAVLAGRLAHALLQGQVIRIARRLKVNITEDVVGRMQGPLTWAASGAVLLVGIFDLQLGV